MKIIRSDYIMRSIGEMIQAEQSNSGSQLRAIAEDYGAAFMDASSTFSDVKPVIDAFDGRVASYEASLQEIGKLHDYQRSMVGRLALVAHPEVNVGFVTDSADSAGSIVIPMPGLLLHEN